MSISDATTRCKTSSSGFTCAVLNSGGCVCTLASIRAGFKIIWGTEICPQHKDLSTACNCGHNTQQQMWADLTGAPCLGNTFTDTSKYESVEAPDYMTSGQPCINYSRSGNHSGEDGETGWMFVRQTEIILKVKPKVFRLEISDYAINVHDGREVHKVHAALSTIYHIHTDILAVRKYGDPTNRARLFMVGTRRDLTAAKEFQDITFKFPEPVFNDSNTPTIRHLAVPDESVPENYWRYGSTTRTGNAAVQGKLHIVARSGNGMGRSNNPNSVPSWDTIGNSQTTYNGGAKRPRLDWIDTGDNAVGPQRLGVPIEAIRMASLHDSYQDWALKHYAATTPIIRRDDRNITADEFIFLCVNNGIPCRLSTAVDVNAVTFLQQVKRRQAEVAHQTCCHIKACTIQHLQARLSLSGTATVAALAVIQVKSKWDANTANAQHCKASLHASSTYACAISSHSRDTQHQIQSALLDSGANIGVFDPTVEDAMVNTTKSKMKIQVADKDFMQGRLDGTLHMLVIDPTTGEFANEGKVFSYKLTTVDAVAKNLFSIDELYAKQGYNLILRQPDFESGISELLKPATASQPAISIPLRYDYKDGGFWIDYVLPDKDGTVNKYRRTLLAAYHEDMHNGAAAAKSEIFLDDEEVVAFVAQAHMCEAVTEVVLGQHQESVQRNIRGVKAGLRVRKKQLNAREFHNDHGHIGCVGTCHICAIAAGSCRRIYALVDKHREQRRGHTWVMDICTVEHRAFDGSKYMIVLRDKMSLAFEVLYLHLRSDAIAEIARWIDRMRSDPAFQSMGYQVISHIETDDAGEWGWQNAEWEVLENKLKFRTTWKCPDRGKAMAPQAKRAIGIIEVTMKALLLQRDLQHGWWRDCADAAKFLLNRFPIISQLATMPNGGDQARPLERLTEGMHSRRQCDREITYFLAPGTPALVHDPAVMGSQLQPKSKWMVAKGMQEEQVISWSPWTRLESRSKSYTAFKMQSGMSYTTVLRLQPEPKSKRQKQIQSDLLEKIIITLPELTEEIRSQAKHPINGQQPLLAVKHAIINSTGVPTVNIDTSVQAPTELGGSVQVQNHLGEVLSVDNDTGELFNKHGEPEITTHKCSKCDASFDSRNRLFEHIKNLNHYADSSPSKRKHDDNNQATEASKQKKQCQVVITTADWDKAEAQKVAHLTITSTCNDRFTKICKRLKITVELHGKYRNWLISHCKLPDGRNIQAEDVPTTRGSAVKPCIQFPYPTGSAWRAIKKSDKTATALSAHGNEVDPLIEAAIDAVIDEIRWQMADTAEHGRIHFAKANQCAQQFASACQARRQRTKAVAVGNPDPSSTLEALETDPQGWSKSIDNEYLGLIKMGVSLIDAGTDGNGYTRAQLLKAGIDTSVQKPVHLGLYHTHKYIDGALDKLKSRAAVKGHKGNMTKGIHYAETFAATPRGDAARILSALAVYKNLKRKTGDVEKAYCWAGLPPGRQLALRFPPGLKQFDSHTGEERYAILRKNLYGTPSAGHAWAKLRNRRILERFNEGDWTCTQAQMDPCLFYITHGGSKKRTCKWTRHDKQATNFQRPDPDDKTAPDWTEVTQRITSNNDTNEIIENTVINTAIECSLTRKLPNSSINGNNITTEFIYQRKLDSKVPLDEAWVSIHTDDLDAVGTTQWILDEIFTQLDDEWSVKETPVDFMLGVKRTSTHGDSGKLTAIEHTMGAYVAGKCYTDTIVSQIC